MNEPIIVGISGGVDSSVTALRLKEEGFDVECVFMKNWEGESDQCDAEQDYKDALSVCNSIGVPLRSTNFSDEYWKNVFKNFIDEYSKGRTPNPDILCNKEVKFKAFLNYAKDIGGAKIATGHYARIKESGHSYQLLKGVDDDKDQSYFLYLLNQEMLSNSLFPIGGIEKQEVRKIAKKNGLLNHAKKDSTGICFIGEQKFFKEFLKKYIPKHPGIIKSVDGEICGEHEGLSYYTIGQRKGLGVGGGFGNNDDPWYVSEKDLSSNTLIISQGSNHPSLYHKNLSADSLHWISGYAPSKNDNLSAKIRYRQKDQTCTITSLSGESCDVKFMIPQFAVTPGQSIVFYDGEICLGGGIINNRS